MRSRVVASSKDDEQGDNPAMPRKTKTDLPTFLHQQPAHTLADLLLDLARKHKEVRNRLERMQAAEDPALLSAAFRKTLTAWKRSRRFLDYREGTALASDVRSWISQVEAELLPQDPPAAMALAQALIESDGAFLDRVDDSNGHMGQALRQACELWLAAAARCETPADEWPPRLMALANDDRYGVREPLLGHADRLLREQALRGLVAAYEQELHAVLARAVRDSERMVPIEAFTVSGKLHGLARALRDPDVSVRAVLAYSPDPNPLQKERFAEEYLEFGKPQEALAWLDGHWGAHEASRWALLAKAHAALGEGAQAAQLRRQIFERSLDVGHLHEWLDLLPPLEQVEAIKSARELAQQPGKNAIAGAQVLLDVGDEMAAEAVLVQAVANLNGRDYTALRPLAEELRKRGRWAGAAACYRAMILSVLERAQSPLYVYAARDWRQLEAVAAQAGDLAPLASHADFVESVRLAHGRKAAFWSAVERAGEKVATGRAMPQNLGG
jgi:hypothetical protein